MERNFRWVFILLDCFTQGRKISFLCKSFKMIIVGVWKQRCRPIAYKKVCVEVCNDDEDESKLLQVTEYLQRRVHCSLKLQWVDELQRCYLQNTKPTVIKRFLFEILSLFASFLRPLKYYKNDINMTYLHTGGPFTL